MYKSRGALSLILQRESLPSLHPLYIITAHVTFLCRLLHFQSPRSSSCRRRASDPGEPKSIPFSSIIHSRSPRLLFGLAISRSRDIFRATTAPLTLCGVCVTATLGGPTHIKTVTPVRDRLTYSVVISLVISRMLDLTPGHERSPSR